MRPVLPRRTAMAAVGYIFAVAMLGTTLPTPFYPVYHAEMHFSDLMVTVIFATYAAGVLASLVATGRISDQIGRRRPCSPA
jgi:MFS family permease